MKMVIPIHPLGREEICSRTNDVEVDHQLIKKFQLEIEILPINQADLLVKILIHPHLELKRLKDLRFVRTLRMLLSRPLDPQPLAPKALIKD